jgi:hypothetical protein
VRCRWEPSTGHIDLIRLAHSVYRDVTKTFDEATGQHARTTHIEASEPLSGLGPKIDMSAATAADVSPPQSSFRTIFDHLIERRRACDDRVAGL